jgi:REP element-mobilizing transposase RayT
VAHDARPAHDARHPVHVTLRSHLRCLRAHFVFPTVRLTLAGLSARRETFRVVHFSVQGNHVHLLVEASDRAGLSAGLRSLAIRLALRLNRLLMRRGKVWVDRSHQHVLKTPRAVRNALVYVLGNHRKHDARSTLRIDPCSSAPYFDGFHDVARAPPTPAQCGASNQGAASDGAPISPPRTWLLASSWKRQGPLSSSEYPSVRAPSRTRSTARQ